MSLQLILIKLELFVVRHEKMSESASFVCEDMLETKKPLAKTKVNSWRNLVKKGKEVCICSNCLDIDKM